MANKDMKKCLNSFLIKKIKLKQYDVTLYPSY